MSKKTIELMYKYFPTCPLCKSDKGYGFSGWVGYHVECKSCGAKWHLLNWLSDEPNMKLVKTSRDPERGTVVGHELLGTIHPVDFWQKMKVKKLRVKTKEVEKEAVIPEATEVREETIPPKPKVSMPLIIGIVVLILLVIVAGIGIHYSQMESQKKPKFNVFDVRPFEDGVVVYIQNIGSKDAHSVEIKVEGYGGYPFYAHDVFPIEKLEILQVGVTEKIIVEKPEWYYDPLDYESVKVAVSCDEGVTQEFNFEEVH